MLFIETLGLSNDHKQLMKEIEICLIEIHANTSKREEKDEEKVPSQITPSEKMVFATVDGVFPDSPADLAGLRRGDGILTFGTMKTSNGNVIQNIGKFVSENENVSYFLLF